MKNETIDPIENLELEIARLNTLAQIHKFAIYALVTLGSLGSVLYWGVNFSALGLF